MCVRCVDERRAWECVNVVCASGVCGVGCVDGVWRGGEAMVSVHRKIHRMVGC